MKVLLIALVAQAVLGCRSVVDQVDPDAPCRDQPGRPAGEFLPSAEEPLIEVPSGPIPYRDCDLRCRDLEKHVDHWTECGCSRWCICFDAARSWNIPEARGREPR